MNVKLVLDEHIDYHLATMACYKRQYYKGNFIEYRILSRSIIFMASFKSFNYPCKKDSGCQGYYVTISISIHTKREIEITERSLFMIGSQNQRGRHSKLHTEKPKFVRLFSRITIYTYIYFYILVLIIFLDLCPILEIIPPVKA